VILTIKGRATPSIDYSLAIEAAPQIDELLRVAKLNIFFIDENQIVS
jgi:hypothetical protein